MLLQTVRPNIVQSIRAYRVEDLMQAAQGAEQHFLYANLTSAQSKQDVLEAIAQAFLFPAHFGKNLDALYDYALRRLILANARNDDAMLAEVARLIEPVAQGWSDMKKTGAPAGAANDPAQPVMAEA